MRGGEPPRYTAHGSSQHTKGGRNISVSPSTSRLHSYMWRSSVGTRCSSVGPICSVAYDVRVALCINMLLLRCATRHHNNNNPHSKRGIFRLRSSPRLDLRQFTAITSLSRNTNSKHQDQTPLPNTPTIRTAVSPTWETGTCTTATLRSGDPKRQKQKWRASARD